MNKAKLLDDFKVLFVLIISILVGNVFRHFFGKMPLNIWVARGIGCLVCGVVYILIDKYVLKKPTDN